jgi:hypothetical protein
MRVVSTFWSRSIWLLSSLLFLRWLVCLVKFTRTIDIPLLFRTLAKAFCLEQANLSFGLIQVPLKSLIALKGICMPTLPIPSVALQLANLLPQFLVLAAKLTDFGLQSIHRAQ